MLKVCLTCRPGVRKLPGLVLSHGYCYFHGLQELIKAGVSTRFERFLYNALLIVRWGRP